MSGLFFFAATVLQQRETRRGTLFLYLNIASDVVANLLQVGLHAVAILLVDDFEQLLQLGTYLADLVVGVGVEEYFLQQVVVFVEHALGNSHVALEGGARRVLMLHDGGKDEGGNEGDGERVGHRLVVLLERVFVDVQPKPLVEVLEEDAPHVVALADDDGVLLGQLLQVSKRGAEHGVRGDVATARLLVELLEVGLHGGYVADDALLGQVGQHLLEHGDGVFQRYGIDEQLGAELAYLLHLREALTVISEAHALRIFLKHGHFVVKT